MWYDCKWGISSHETKLHRLLKLFVTEHTSTMHKFQTAKSAVKRHRNDTKCIYLSNEKTNGLIYVYKKMTEKQIYNTATTDIKHVIHFCLPDCVFGSYFNHKLITFFFMSASLITYKTSCFNLMSNLNAGENLIHITGCKDEMLSNIIQFHMSRT